MSLIRAAQDILKGLLRIDIVALQLLVVSDLSTVIVIVQVVHLGTLVRLVELLVAIEVLFLAGVHVVCDLVDHLWRDHLEHIIATGCLKQHLTIITATFCHGKQAQYQCSHCSHLF